MRRPILVVLFAFVAVVTACVGEDFASDSSQPPDGGGGADSSSSSGSSSGSVVDSSSGDDDAALDAAPAKRLVFVTSAQVGPTFALGSDPWAAGDALCATEATANSRSGSFVAWLSYKSDAGTAFNAVSRIADAAYYLPISAAEGGAPLLAFESKTELLATGPRVPLDRLPNGQEVASDSAYNTDVWTGTDGSGNATDNHCQRFTTSVPDGGINPSATIGNAKRLPTPTASDWTKQNQRTCDATRKARVYCFQK